MYWAVKFGVGVVGFLILFWSIHPTHVPAKAAGLLTKNLGFSCANSAFRIAVFADLHYGENAWTDWGPLQDQNSDRVMANVLNMENPGDTCFVFLQFEMKYQLLFKASFMLFIKLCKFINN